VGLSAEPVPLQSLLKGLGLAVSTIGRKLKKEERLSPAESDRVWRVLAVFEHAKEAFEDPSLAAQWIKRPLAGLDYMRPLDVLDTQPGYDRVQAILLRLETGVTA
jgi:putative toxin-antitoxin system antitoxin component (TIGR02293 family)